MIASTIEASCQVKLFNKQEAKIEVDKQLRSSRAEVKILNKQEAKIEVDEQFRSNRADILSYQSIGSGDAKDDSDEKNPDEHSHFSISLDVSIGKAKPSLEEKK